MDEKLERLTFQLEASCIELHRTAPLLIDQQLVRFNHFSGDGAATEPQISEHPTVVKLCSSAFEAVWERAIPHEDYAI